MSECDGKLGNSIRSVTAAYGTALSFLTTVPVHVHAPDWRVLSVRSLRWYPAVGASIGAIVALAGLLCRYLLGSLPAAAIMVAAEGLITGGLHWDGLSDSADALFSRRPVEEQLGIMRDSRLGTFGASALFVDLILKFSLYATLVGSPFVLPLTITGYTVSRGVLPRVIVGFPYARNKGLGAGLQTGEAAREASWAAAVTVALLAGAAALLGATASGQGYEWFVLQAFVALLAVAGLVYWLAGSVAGRISSHLGGLTGDVYGAIAELALAMFLLLCIATLHLMGGFL